MEAASERRDPQATRVPLDDVLVDLYPEGHDESFPADAIDVGLGGLAMRSAVLPDVGSRLRCRFRSPGDGASVAADAEVVWAADSGPNTGQFGLRFTELEAEDAERIAGLVDAWHESLGAISIANDTDDSVAVERRVSLRLDGVGPAVETELVHADRQAMIVEQPLPFLTIGKGVQSAGRRGILEAVDLRMDGATPRLTLTVLFDRAESTLADATVQLSEVTPSTMDESDEAPEPAFAGAPIEPREVDARGPASVSTADEPSEHEDAFEGSVEADPEPVVEARSQEPILPDDAIEAETAAPVEAGQERKADPLLSELRADPRAAIGKALSRALPLWVKVRAWLLVAWAKVGPWMKIAGSRTRAFATRCWTTLRSLRGASARKRTQRRPQQRQRQTRAPRQQARPGERGRGAGTDPAHGGSRRRIIARIVALAAVLGLGAVLTRFAFADDMGTLSITKAPIAMRETPVSESPMPETAIDPESGDDPSGTEAAAEPSPEGGRLDAPSFPAMPTASDSAQPLAFGEARVAGGREFRLRLSVPPTALRGEPTGDGFKVTVEGSNAIDGARRIGATHPRVARASILNEGERAVLTIRFAAGANPAYRVEARGDALLVTIGR